MTVTSGGSVSTMSLPSNGLIYVDNAPGAECPSFNPLTPYADAPGCGDVYVRGSYAASLTIGAKRDVVVNGDLTEAPDSDSLLGLIAEHFVRVEHRMSGTQTMSCPTGTSNVGGAQDRTIEAAILSLKHVFTVDNYQCGGYMGTLSVRGAIGQKYRGPVATGGSGDTPSSGYTKAYSYDDRLRFRSPPYFLTPVESAWRTMRITEQSPAR